MPKKTVRQNKKTTGADPEDYWTTKQEPDKKGGKCFEQIIFRDWCKGCGICVAFCPKKVYDRDKTGKPVCVRPDACIGCRFCEQHCPDFAITIKQCFADQRTKTNGTNSADSKTPAARQ